jgi:hypothetical protein
MNVIISRRGALLMVTPTYPVLQTYKTRKQVCGRTTKSTTGLPREKEFTLNIQSHGKLMKYV